MAEVERRCGGVYAGVETYFAGFEEVVEGVAVTGTYLSLRVVHVWCEWWTCISCDLVDETSFFEEAERGLLAGL